MSRPGHRGTSRLRLGFSLLELVIVMTLIAIVGAIAIPRYGASLANHRVDAAARRIAADLDYARRQARFASSSTTIVFDIATHQYSDSVTTVALEDDPYKTIIVSVNFGGDAEIVFDGFGRPDSGGSVLVQSGDRKRTVALDGDSGRVTIE